MIGKTLTATAIVLASLPLLAGEAQAMAPRDVDDLVGARASSGEAQLMMRGYRYRKTIKVSDNSIAYWWNRDKQACIAVTTEDGHYKAIMSQPAAVCDKDAMAAHNYGGTHRGTEDLVGVRASSGEKALQDRGYSLKSTQRGADRTWSNWWNAAHRKCITVMTKDGHYEAITDTLPADCEGENASAGSEAPPGGFGAAAIPQVMTVDGGNVSVDMGGCNVLFNPRGGIVNQGRSCTDSDVRAARDAFNSSRREQSAPAGAEAPPGGFGGGGGMAGTFTCESNDGQYQFCRHPMGPNAQVKLVRRLSNNDCTQGRSWGIDTDGVWVDKGCRAVFEVR